MSKVIIVDDQNRIIGAEDGRVAIQKGLTRSISRIFLFNKDGEIYLQRRSKEKIWYPDRWDESAGGHVDEGETYEQAAYRELNEELGIHNIQLKEIMRFQVKELFNAKKVKSFDALFIGYYDSEKFVFEKEEVSYGQWFKVRDVDEMISKNPNDFAPGFLIAWKKYWITKVVLDK